MNRIRVEVVYALPQTQWTAELDFETGATVNDALRAVAGSEGFRELDLDAMTVGVWGKVVDDRNQLLADEDRVEIYRPLEMDAMTARRVRAAQASRRRGQEQ